MYWMVRKKEAMHYRDESRQWDPFIIILFLLLLIEKISKITKLPYSNSKRRVPNQIAKSKAQTHQMNG